MVDRPKARRCWQPEPTGGVRLDCNATGACSFNGSGSTDSDGTVASYAWTFGDGGTASTRPPSHAYTASGTYAVKLTVTDNQGATGSITHQVAVTVPTPPNGIAFVASAHSGAGSQVSKSVTVPASASVGDTMVLVFTSGTGNTWSSPGAGWSQVGTTLTNVSINSTAWVKTVAGGDPVTPR